MMRLCYLAYSPLDLQSANSIQTFNTCRALERLVGESLTVIVPRFGRHETESPFPVVWIPRLPVNKLSLVLRSAVWSYVERTLYAWVALLFLVAQRAVGKRYDLIYSRDIVCAFWLAVVRLPLVYEVHDLEAEHPSSIKGRWLKKVLARVDRRTIVAARAVISLTSTFREELLACGWQAPARVFVIPDAYDESVYFPRSCDQSRERLNMPLDSTVIGYAGLTFRYRRVDLLLEAMSKWKDPRASVLIIGGRLAEIKALKKRAEDLGVSQKVMWLGRRAPTETADYLSAADILVIPETVTTATASPLKMFEYLALARPIIAVDRPALREILIDGTADFFRPGDSEDLAGALRRLAGDPARRAEMGAQAAERARGFTYALRAERIIEACKTVQSQARSRATQDQS